MSGAEQVDSFNPMLIVIWITQLLLLGWDWSQDQRIWWSIPIIGSFFFIQLYMIWKTNHDKMMEEERDRQARALGGPVDTPEIVPGQTKLKDLYKNSDNNSAKNTKKSDKSMINLNTDTAEE